MIFPPTPSQTVGPYYAIGLPWGDGPHVVPDGAPGAIRLHGTIYDGRGEPIPDHLIETWQCDPDGRFPDLRGTGADGDRLTSALDGFRGFGRHGEEHGDGTYAILTVKPGRVPVAVAGGGEVLQAPHVDVSLFARGLLDRVVTRVYFADEAEANAADPTLAELSEDERATLVAAPAPDGYAIDVRLSGDGETAFLRT